MGKKSKEWLERGERRIPGGVNSPVRAFRAVGGDPADGPASSGTGGINPSAASLDLAWAIFVTDPFRGCASRDASYGTVKTVP